MSGKTFIGLAGYRESGKSLIAEILRSELMPRCAIHSAHEYAVALLNESVKDANFGRNVAAETAFLSEQDRDRIFPYLQDVIRIRDKGHSIIVIDDLVSEKLISLARETFRGINIVYVEFKPLFEVSAICESKRVDKPFENIDYTLRYEGRPAPVRESVRRMLAEWNLLSVIK